MIRTAFVAFLFCLVASRGASAQDPDAAFDFWLSRNFVRSLADSRGLFYKLTLSMDHRTGEVHDLGGDCELHIAATPTDAQGRFWPKGIVVEPPSLCKVFPPGVPGGGETALRTTIWPGFLDTNVMGSQCEVTGFPRLFTEHASGSVGPTNPNHVFEIHPAMKISCGPSFTLDMTAGFLQAFPGLRAIKSSSAANCLEGRELFVRKKSGSAGRYEFKEQGGGSCGNFMIVEVTAVNPEWIKVLPNGGGRSALARVRVDERGPFTVKLYAYPGSPADVILQAIAAGGDLPEHLHLHGVTTYDFFSIMKATQGSAPDFAWLQSIPTWKRVAFPVALVVFGDIAVEEPADPEE